MTQEDLFYDLLQATIDGFFTGANAIGTGIGQLTNDKRNIGYQADRYGLIGLKKRADFLYGPHAHIMAKCIDRVKQKGLAEKAVKAVGEVIGLGVNVVSLGLTEAMFLGDVYCRDKTRLERIN